MRLENLKPSVKKENLILISGLLWSVVGIFLNIIASKWIPSFSTFQIILIYTVGTLLGLGITKFGFSKLALKNVNRINEYSQTVCFFAFQRWQMYFLIAFMMSLGIFMRSTSFIPKSLLAPIYVGIGLALFLSSFVYYRNFFEF